MAEYITEEQFLILVAEKVREAEDDRHTYADADLDVVDGMLSTVVQATLDVHSEHGPVLFGD